VGQFTLLPAWGQASPQDQQDIIDFWLTHKALPSAEAARQRVAQVVMFARDADGCLAGVCTAVPQRPPQLGQPVYFYRSFIAPEHRQTLLVFRMLKKAMALLEADAREHQWPCIGILLELENERFRNKGRMPVWPGIDFVYIGRSPRGLECRVHWFHGARLKA
jgi:hypothetical protein